MRIALALTLAFSLACGGSTPVVSDVIPAGKHTVQRLDEPFVL